MSGPSRYNPSVRWDFGSPLVAALGAALAAAGQGGAAFACELVLEEPGAVVVEHDAFGLDATLVQAELVARNEGDEPCDAVLVLTDVLDEGPPFAIEKSALALRAAAPALAPASPIDLRPGEFDLVVGPGEVRTVVVDLIAEGEGVVRAGTYETDLLVTLRSPTGEAFGDARPLRHALVVPPLAQVNVAGTDARFGEATYEEEVNFGEPEIGESRRLFVQLRSNATAVMTVASDHGGRMTHVEEDGSFIGYEARLGEVMLDLTEPFSVPDIAATDANGTSTPLDLTIDEVVRPLAGRYEDRIVIEVVAQ